MGSNTKFIERFELERNKSKVRSKYGEETIRSITQLTAEF